MATSIAGGLDIGTAIEGVVAVLLLVTIGYCAVLNRRLTGLRSDETALKTTIMELVNATTMAERAIAGLKATVGECERTLGERLGTADRIASKLAEETEAAEGVLGRIARITETARRSVTEPPMSQLALQAAAPVIVPRPEPVAAIRATAARAEALAARARLRSQGAAA